MLFLKLFTDTTIYKLYTIKFTNTYLTELKQNEYMLQNKLEGK